MIPNRLLHLFSEKPFSIVTREIYGETEVVMCFDSPYADVKYTNREPIQDEIETHLASLGYSVEDGVAYQKVFSK